MSGVITSHPGTSFMFRVLSLQRSAHDRRLHSFPTRRSSDLREEPADPDAAILFQFCPRNPALRDLLGHLLFAKHALEQIGRAHVELQSPYDPVCRLLLEKKKKPQL